MRTAHHSRRNNFKFVEQMRPRRGCSFSRKDIKPIAVSCSVVQCHEWLLWGQMPHLGFASLLGWYS